jgi:hypothetical protein
MWRKAAAWSRNRGTRRGLFCRRRRQTVGNIDNGLKNEIVSIVAMFSIALDFVCCRGNREPAIIEPLSLQREEIK